jgi:hypothetical protein
MWKPYRLHILQIGGTTRQVVETTTVGVDPDVTTPISPLVCLRIGVGVMRSQQICATGGMMPATQKQGNAIGALQQHRRNPNR